MTEQMRVITFVYKS